MVCCTPQFYALMRRNLLYRRRYFIATLLEMALPIAFAGLLLWIKNLADDASSFIPTRIPADIPTLYDTLQPLTFSDFVTAIVAKRYCIARGGGSFDITGLPDNNYDWQVPFVKCDSRNCQEDGEEAYPYCVYPIMVLAPNDASDTAGRERALNFSSYIDKRYPQLSDPELTHFPNNYSFVQIFDSSKSIDDYVKASDYGTTGKEQIGVAVVFQGNDESNVQYTIRVNSTNINKPEADELTGTTTPNTAKLFDHHAKSDSVCTPVGASASQGPLSSSCTGQYIYNGFLATQRLVQDYVLAVVTNAKEEGYFVAEHGVRYVKFPSKPYEVKGFYGELAQFMPLLLTLGILYPCAAMISYIVQEKELRQKELMKMMGVTESELGWSWFLSFWAFHFVTATFVSLVSGNLFENSDFILLFVFWQFCFLGFVVLSMLLSTLVSKTTRGVLIGLLVVFAGYFLTQVASVETGNPAVLSLVSLHPVSAMAYAIQELGRLEDSGVGLTFSSMVSTDAPSGYTFSNAYGNLLLSSVVLGILTWYLNRVVPPAYGQALPPWFPFTMSYWWPGRSVPDDDGEFNEAKNEDSGIPLEPVSDALKQQEREGQNIEIKNLRKDFGEKVAVDGLNLSIYNGQITALLGHNGAGKTTTIGMLTGALAPTEGTATIVGKDIRRDMREIRGNIGICLQHDCLFPKLTVREHVQFFSRLKGIYGKMSNAEAEASIDQAIRDVALEEKSHTYSSNLSGGMKRKLSVAMAFCGGSKVVFLDEPTSGMDPFSRRFSWNVIRQYRQDRCIILTTHFMDEADILGDRIAIMSDGGLRCCGSSLFLKRTYGVGYQLTIEKPTSFSPDANGVGSDIVNEDDLKDIVVGSVAEATLLSDVGTELSFQLPLSASDKFVPMLERLDDEKARGRIVAYGLSITTLDEVFLLVARGEGNKKEFTSSRYNSSSNLATGDDVDERSVRSKMDLDNGNLFGTHVHALWKKRGANFKRDKKAWCCTTVTPSMFVLFGLLILKYAIPSRNLEALPLNLNDYNPEMPEDEIRNPIPFNNPETYYTCNPGRCTMQRVNYTLKDTNETYYFCGGAALASSREEYCSIDDSKLMVDELSQAGADAVGGDVETIQETAMYLFARSYSLPATMYGGIFFTHEAGSVTQSNSNVSYGDTISALCANNTGDYMQESECDLYGTGIGYVVTYNFTALHSAPLFQMLADESIVRHATGSSEFKLSASIHPMPVTQKEEKYAAAGDSIILWFLVVLSFPFIGGAFATFVVQERESKAKHLQTVAGVKPSAYWISTFLWDSTNYLIPFTITVILLFAFDMTVFTTTENGVLSGVLMLLLLFGPAAAAMSYCISFMFKSPSLCNVFIIISGFLIALGASITTLILRLIGTNPFDPKDKLVRIAIAIEWVGRFFPTFCLGKGLFYVINMEGYSQLLGRKLSAWDPDILLYEVIFLAAESVVYLLLAMYIDVLSSNPGAMLFWNKLFGCRRSSKYSEVATIADDDDVVAEQERVLNGQANDDAIVMSELSKVYQNGKIAVDNISLGIAPGECFGLLGINGAGKTTAMAMLTAEFPPTGGDATLAGYSLRREPEKTRRRIGYCPQFDAHFTNLTGREHVEMYAQIKGVPDYRDAAATKLAQVGLSKKDSDRLSSNYSGGMKRRLSLACATIGQPELVFLDECSTGVDPVARREIWQMVSDLVSEERPDNRRASVVLTTHSMEECEALCPRIGIMANGKLRCLGSAQHLKTKFGKGFQLELKVAAVSRDDDDCRLNQVFLARSKGHIAADEEEVPENTEAFFNLQEAQSALFNLTQDDYLSSMLNQDNPTGFAVFKDATSASGVSLGTLSSFVANELRMRHLGGVVFGQYPTCILRERQDMKARFEISSADVSIAQIFAFIEENKENLRLADYGISQTSLEQVFNMHAAEAERLKQGRVDG
ncbi:Retinal-specific ATP-binding cassette transporter [Seminavis robusta]|uniref:Retinal-specific ATP-binding cassette transporter n=1 Tax=Seminavis robusta TaxID=568900 RepID=A0A9N8DRZ1_9STRA|nr:Retinal-specific ATP-binding cassette transporter [Seminavis robusta]|eukprot:Sro239_g095950.1 Retinal-specific ATP-binding cassette transporter (1929) ;mRNA; f:53810-61132